MLSRLTSDLQNSSLHPCLVAPKGDNLLTECALERCFESYLPRCWRHVSIAFFPSWNLRAIVVGTPVIAIMKWYWDVNQLIRLVERNDTIETWYSRMCFSRFLCLGPSRVLDQSATIVEIQFPQLSCECIIDIFISIIASASLQIFRYDRDCSMLAYWSKMLFTKAWTSDEG